MKSLEIFAGVGGLALGLHKAGFSPVALIEKDPRACANLRLNHPHWNVLESDIAGVEFSDFGKVDLVSGGPPCQPFSAGGLGRGHVDKRDMFPQAVRAVAELLPKAFIFENVQGLMRPSFREYVEYIVLRLTFPLVTIKPDSQWSPLSNKLRKLPVSDALYQVRVHRVDAADYGVPQRRRRIFLVGLRSDFVSTGEIFPEPTHSKEELMLGQWANGSYWREHNLPAPRSVSQGKLLEVPPPRPHPAPRHRWRTVRDALSGLPHPRLHNHYLNHSYRPGAKAYPGHTGSILDEPSKTIKSGVHGVPGGENMVVQSNGKIRYFSVREAARIQTFPDDHVFEGSWSEAMKQIGNAVPPLLAQSIGLSLMARMLSED